MLCQITGEDSAIIWTYRNWLASTVRNSLTRIMLAPCWQNNYQLLKKEILSLLRNAKPRVDKLRALELFDARIPDSDVGDFGA